MPSVDLYLAVPPETGWAPIRSMAALLAEYLDVTPIEVDVHASLAKPTKALSLLPRLRGGEKTAIVIAYDPGQLNAIAQKQFVFKRYKKIIGWVIDSFWSERIPRIAQATSTFDHIFVTDAGDVDDWRQQGVKNVSALPWGSDIWSSYPQRLRAASSKTIDLLRVGRQPEAWNDDTHTGELAALAGLSFHGRPAFGNTPAESAQHLESELRQAKTVLAFSVRTSPTSYTHPTKDYLTGRWIDALGWGCTVVGARPQSHTASTLLWEGSTFEIDSTDINHGMAQVKELLKATDAKSAQRNVRLALETFDWRHRFKTLFILANLHVPQLDKDIHTIEETLATGQSH